MVAPITELINLWTVTEFPWQFIAVLCVLISIAYSAIAYMVSNALKNEELKKWARAEMIYAISTIFLIAFFLAFMTTISNTMTEFTLETTRIAAPQLYHDIVGRDPIALPLFYVDRVTHCARTTYVRVACTNFLTEPIARIEIKEPGKVPTAPEVSIPRTLMHTAHMITQSLQYYIYLLYFQQHLLYFITGTMFTIFLPIGIILRTFSVTRGPGNLFIALSLGLGIVYPLGYGIVLAVSQPVGLVESRCGITGDTPPGGQLTSCVGMAAGSAAMSAVSLPFSFLPKITDFTGAKFAKWGTTFAATAAMVGIFYGQVQSMLSEIILYAIIYPIVIATLTLTFIKSFSEFLGVSAQDFAQGLIRLI